MQLNHGKRLRLTNYLDEEIVNIVLDNKKAHHTASQNILSTFSVFPASNDL